MITKTNQPVLMELLPNDAMIAYTVYSARSTVLKAQSTLWREEQNEEQIGLINHSDSCGRNGLAKPTTRNTIALLAASFYLSTVCKRGATRYLGYGGLPRRTKGLLSAVPSQPLRSPHDTKALIDVPYKKNAHQFIWIDQREDGR